MTLPRIPERIWKRVFFTMVAVLLVSFYAIASTMNWIVMENLRAARWPLGIAVLFMIRWQVGCGWFVWITKTATLLEGIERAVISGFLVFVRHIQQNWRALVAEARREVAQ